MFFILLLLECFNINSIQTQIYCQKGIQQKFGFITILKQQEAQLMQVNISLQATMPVHSNSPHLPHNYVNKRKQTLQNQLQQRKSKEQTKKVAKQIFDFQQKERSGQLQKSLKIVSSRPKVEAQANSKEDGVHNERQQNSKEVSTNIQNGHRHSQPQIIRYKKSILQNPPTKQDNKKNLRIAQNYAIVPKNLQKSFKQLCYKLRQQEKTKWEYLKPLSNIDEVLGKFNSVDKVKVQAQYSKNADLIRNRRKMKKAFETKRDHILNDNVSSQKEVARRDRSLEINMENTQEVKKDDGYQAGQKVFVPNFKYKERSKHSKDKYLHSSKRNNSLLPNLNLYRNQAQESKEVEQFTNIKLQITNKLSQEKQLKKNVLKQSFEREYSKSNVQQHKSSVVQISQKKEYRGKKRNNRVNTKLIELKIKGQEALNSQSNIRRSRQYTTLEPKKNPITIKKQAAKIRKINSQLSYQNYSKPYEIPGNSSPQNGKSSQNIKKILASSPSKINLTFQ